MKPRSGTLRRSARGPLEEESGSEEHYERENGDAVDQCMNLVVSSG
jgi:hypothetical protein